MFCLRARWQWQWQNFLILYLLENKHLHRPEHFARPTSGTRQNHFRTWLKCPEQVLRTCQAISQQPVVQEQSLTYQFISTLNDEFISKVLLCIKQIFD